MRICPQSPQRSTWPPSAAVRQLQIATIARCRAADSDAPSLQAGEFIRRFLIHVLPDGFNRIRYFGFLGNCHRARKLALCRELLRMPAAPADPPADYRDRYEALTGMSLRQCPYCLTGIMVVISCIERPRVCQTVPDT